MATQFTSILKLALPTQGELSGSWGTVVNENITTMIEQAIAGLATINTWSSNSHTLTIASGLTSESRCAMLSLTDTNTQLSAAGTVVCPALSKTYIVKNGAGQIVTVKTASGSGIAIPSGKTMLLFCDGTNVVEAVDHVVTMSAGTLTITGLTTFASIKGVDSTTVTGILDEDNMASNSATKLVTQQSVKAYVDSQVGTVDTLAEILANGNTTGGANIVASTDDKVQFRDSSIYINSSADGQLDIVADTEIQIAATTVDINGAVALNGAVTGATNVTLSGELDAATGDFSGAVDIDGALDVAGTTNLDVVDIDGATQIDATVSVGVDDTGYDVKFFGATSGKSLLWDESADSLIVTGTSQVANTAIASVAISGVSRASNTVTVTNSAVHGLTQGDIVNLNGVSDTSFNGYFTVASISSTTVFTFAQTAANATSSGGFTTEIVYSLLSSGTALSSFAGPVVLNANSAIDGLEITQAGAGDALNVTGTTTMTGNSTVSGTLGVTGVLTGTSLDISGDIDVDGTTNLDVVDIDGAVDMASTLGVGGRVTAAGVTTSAALISTSNSNNLGNTIISALAIDNFTIDGTTIALTSGDMTLDAAGNINLDADGGSVFFKDAGTEFFKIRNTGSDVQIYSARPDADMKFEGVDGSVGITALLLDMSASGRATFNNNVVVTDNNSLIAGSGDDLQIFYNGTNGEIDVSSGNLTLDVAGDIILDADGGDVKVKDAGTEFCRITNSAGSVQIYAPVQDKDTFLQNLLGNDGNTTITMLTLDASEAGAATFSSTIAATGATFAATSGRGLVISNATTTHTNSVAVLDAQHSNGSLSFKTAGTERFNIATDGAATFNSSITATSLDISGDIDIDGTTNLDVVDIDGAVDMASTLAIAGDVTITSAGPLISFVDSDNNPDYQIKNGNGTFRIIDTTNSFDKISMSSTETVVNDTSADLDFRVKSDGNANMLFVDGGENHVGIGTATLNRSGLGADHICLTVGADNQMGMLELQGTRTSNADLGRVSFLNAGTKRAEIVAARVDEDNSTKLYFQTSNAGSLGTRLTIGKDGAATFNAGATFDGNVSIGTSSSFGGLINVPVTTSDEAMVTQSNSASSSIHFNFRNTNGFVGSISTSGTATAYNTSSDYRLKENVVAMSGATARLNQLQPKRFNFIADADVTVDGFLAHEVADVVPEAITGTKDAMIDEEYEVTPAVLDEEGNVTTKAVTGTRSVPNYQGIDQSKLVPLLVATIQELEARITQLENN